MKKVLFGILLGFFLISLTSASQDVQVWTGQYYSGTSYLQGNYSFNFTVYDNLTAGNICYSNTTNLSTGYWGQWSTEHFGILSACSNQSKNYWVNINIAGTDQTPRRRLTLIGNWTAYELKKAYEAYWINDTILINSVNTSLSNRIDGISTNSSFNQSLTDSLYSAKLWGYNMTQPFTDWLSTFIYNYNQTTATFNQYNSTWDNSWVNQFAYNHTLAIENLYGKWFYNMSTPFYNWLSNPILTNNVNLTGNLIVGGNVSIKRPYGMFSSTQTQNISVANTAYPMTFNWTEDSYQVYKSSDNSNFSFGQTGDYLIELSIIAQGNQGDKAEIWVQKNGVNIPRSNTIYDFKGTGANAVIAVPFILDMNMTDHFRVMYAGSATTVKLQYTTNTSYSPETPSCIMTISKISEITP